MKKIVLWSTLFFVVISSFIACKNDNHNSNLVGTWSGKYDDQTENGVLNADICLEVKDGNELIVHDKTSKADATGERLGQGTWLIEGETVKFIYKYLNKPSDTTTHHNEGRLDKTGKKIDGTLRKAGDEHLGGFYLEKK